LISREVISRAIQKVIAREMNSSPETELRSALLVTALRQTSKLTARADANYIV